MEGKRSRRGLLSPSVEGVIPDPVREQEVYRPANSASGAPLPRSATYMNCRFWGFSPSGLRASLGQYSAPDPWGALDHDMRL